jgi:hypothetical protein
VTATSQHPAAKRFLKPPHFAVLRNRTLVRNQLELFEWAIPPINVIPVVGAPMESEVDCQIGGLARFAYHDRLGVDVPSLEKTLKPVNGTFASSRLLLYVLA